MKRFIICIIGIFLIFIENSMTNYINIFGASFNLLLPCLVMISLYLEDSEAGLIGAFLGLIKDITVGGIFGLNALILAVICYLISHYRRNLYRDDIGMVIGLVAGVSMIDSFVSAIAAYFVYYMDGILIVMSRRLIVIPILNSIIGLVIYKLFNSSIRKLEE